MSPLFPFFSLCFFFCCLFGRTGEAASVRPGVGGQQHDQDHRVWPLRAGHVVPLALPGGVRPPGEAVHVRVLPEVHEEPDHPAQTHGAAAALWLMIHPNLIYCLNAFKPTAKLWFHGNSKQQQFKASFVVGCNLLYRHFYIKKNKNKTALCRLRPPAAVVLVCEDPLVLWFVLMTYRYASLTKKAFNLFFLFFSFDERFYFSLTHVHKNGNGRRCQRDAFKASGRETRNAVALWEALGWKYTANVQARCLCSWLTTGRTWPLKRNAVVYKLKCFQINSKRVKQEE